MLVGLSGKRPEGTGSMQRENGRRRWSVAIGLVLITALCAWLAHAVASESARWGESAATLFERLRALSAGQLLLLIAGLLASYALRAYRLYNEWAPRVGAGYGACWRVVALHNALVNLLPMRSGEVGYAWLLHRRWRVPLAQSAASLAWWRLQDMLIVAVFAVAFLVPWPLGWRLLAAAALVVLIVSMLSRYRARVTAALQRVAQRRLGARPGSRLAQAALALAAAIDHQGGGATAWVCGAANWSAKLMTLGALLSWLASLEAGPAIAGAVGGELGAALPTQPLAGFGPYEAGVWAAVSLWAVQTPAEVLLGAALCAHLLILAVALALGGAAGLFDALATRQAGVPGVAR